MTRLLAGLLIVGALFILTAFDTGPWHRAVLVRVTDTVVDAQDSIRLGGLDEYILTSRNLTADDSVTFVIYQTYGDSIILERFVDASGGVIEMHIQLPTDSIHVTQFHEATVTQVLIRR